MTQITYNIAPHDGGWAYRLGAVFSETYPTHDVALAAARRVAAEQQVAGETTGITYEDDRGQWREELSPGDDRPAVQVSDKA